MKIKLNPVLLITFFGLMIVFSCKKYPYSDNTCNVKDPLRDLAWLKNDITFIDQLDPTDSQYITIEMATYQGATVFYSIVCDPLGNSTFPIWNCSGETIGYWGEIPAADLKDQQVIWRSEYCVCQI